MNSEPITESSQVQVQCAHCGEPIVLDVPADAKLALMVVKRARMGMVHDHCAADYRRKVNQSDEAERLAKRMMNWKILCDPFYQGSRAWLESGGRTNALRLDKLDEAKKWPFGDKGLLMFGSKTGTGKTTAAWLLCEREFMAGRLIVALTHAEMSMKATLLARDGTLDLVGWRTLVRSCHLLFIDDLGKSKFTTASGEGKAAEEFLFDLINHRATHNRPCLITCNTAGAGLRQAMSPDRAEPFVRRLNEFNVKVNFDSK